MGKFSFIIWQYTWYYFEAFGEAHKEVILVMAKLYISHDPNQPTSPHSGVLLVHLLRRCNLLCQHCYLDAISSQNNYLPADLVIRSLNEVKSLGISTVYLSGGEPMLYPELPNVLDSISRQRCFDLCISTNGTLINEENVALLKDNKARVQVSIDGPAEYHDQFRGIKGTFFDACKGIEHMIAAEVPVSIITTICRDNINWLPRLAELAHEMGVDHIIVQPLEQLGRGFNIRDKKLSNDQLCDLSFMLSDLGSIYRSSGLSFSLACYTHKFLQEHPCAAYACNGNRCHRNISKEIKRLVIREDGTVLPEIPTLDYRFALGNLKEGTLAELIHRYFENGYDRFDRLCRTVYDEVMPTWDSPFILWEEMISDRSKSFDI